MFDKDEWEKTLERVRKYNVSPRHYLVVDQKTSNILMLKIVDILETETILVAKSLSEVNEWLDVMTDHELTAKHYDRDVIRKRLDCHIKYNTDFFLDLKFYFDTFDENEKHKIEKRYIDHMLNNSKIKIQLDKNRHLTDPSEWGDFDDEDLEEYNLVITSHKYDDADGILYFADMYNLLYPNSDFYKEIEKMCYNRLLECTYLWDKEDQYDKLIDEFIKLDNKFGLTVTINKGLYLGE